MSDALPQWAGAIAASLAGSGFAGQAVRAIYRDWRAARAAEKAEHAAEIARRDARITALEEAALTSQAAHRDTTERLMREGAARDDDAWVVLVSLRELPSILRDLPRDVADLVRERLSDLRERDSAADDGREPPRRRKP